MTTAVWFRKNLRVHDNAALTNACGAEKVLPLYCLDPAWATPSIVGPNRCRFLLESLEDLDETLKTRYGSRLHVVVGDPQKTITKLIRDGTITKVVFEEEVAEPRELALEKRVVEAHPDEAHAVASTHLLYDADAALSKGAPPTKMPGMVTLAGKLGPPSKPLPAPSTLPPRPAIDTPPLPSLESLGYASIPTKAAYGVQGGESKGLARLQEQMERDDGAWARAFEKPKTTSASFEAPTQRPFPSISHLKLRRWRLHDHRNVAVATPSFHAGRAPDDAAESLRRLRLRFGKDLPPSAQGDVRQGPACSAADVVARPVVFQRDVLLAW